MRKMISENEKRRWAKLAGIKSNKGSRSLFEGFDPEMGDEGEDGLTLDDEAGTDEMDMTPPEDSSSGGTDQLVSDLAVEIGKAIEKVTGVSVNVDSAAVAPESSVPETTDEMPAPEMDSPETSDLEAPASDEEDMEEIKEDKTANKGNGPGKKLPGFKDAPKPKLSEARIKKIANNIAKRVADELVAEGKIKPKK